ncbi:oocyte zinc finger protein XlCOF6-like [Hyperolius riggenbachi]|uniref:oocyte zinc finger protein XlCOF6-like n=1 Tax=Hyperolius riggenbachi TaxID=752182 RepID=UPI0035A307EB
MSQEWRNVYEKILGFTLEIISLLTGEDYTVLKKTFVDRWASIVNPPGPTLLPEKNDKRILEITSKMTELLTGEVPVRCQDVAICFSMEEWQYMEGHKDLYKDIVMENQPPLTSLDGSNDRNPPERCTGPLYSQECTQKDHTSPHQSQDDLLIGIRVEASGNDTEELYAGGDKSYKEANIAAEFRTEIEEPAGDDLDCPVSLSPELHEEDDDLTENTIPSPNICPAPQSVHWSSELSNAEQLSPNSASSTTEQSGAPIFSCYECGMTFTQDMDLSLHQQDHSTKNIFRCMDCGKSFGYRSLLITHQRIHTGERPFACSDCGKRFTQKGSLVNHQWTHATEKPFDCIRCGKCFSSSSNLAMHKKIHMQKREHRKTPTCRNVLVNHKKIDQREKQYSCSKNRSFTEALHLEKHQKVHKDKTPFSCSECDKCFNYKSVLAIHLRVHTGEKPFTCSDCGKSFAQKVGLITHLRVHTGERPFKCSECGKCFAQKHGLVTHKMAHKTQKLFKGSDCRKGLKNATRLAQHRKAHAGKKPFWCSTCKKGFKSNWALGRHQKDHPGEKPVQCLECGKDFPDTSALAKHRCVREEEELFHCSECGKDFAFKSLLLMHQRVHTGERPFTCSDCGKGFAQKAGLVAHQRIHTGEKPFSCLKCGKQFTQKGHLVKHQQLHSTG